MLSSVVLVACASAPEGVDDYYMQFDAGVGPGPTRDTGAAAPVDAGIAQPMEPVVPVLDSGVSPARDSGTPPRDSGAPREPEAGVLTPADSGRPPAVVDSGSVVDTGAPRPVDSGVSPTPDAGGGGQTCTAAPAYSTRTACGQCTCMKCAQTVTQCYASSDSAKNMQCASVRACAEQNECTREACYCGGSGLCLNPDGPCRGVIETAAGSDSPLDVQSQADDPNTALGRSVAVGACQLQNCRSECGL